MNAGDRRRLYERAGILMVTRGMDPARAIIEAAKQLGITGEGRSIDLQRGAWRKPSPRRNAPDCAAQAPPARDRVPGAGLPREGAGS
jgi:hypothetical protein